jgi:hypothetical protein
MRDTMSLFMRVSRDGARRHRTAELVDAYNGNSQVYDSYGFNGDRTYSYGSGLVPHLHRLGSRRYEMSDHHIRLASTKTKRRK